MKALWALLYRAICEHQPDAVLSIGQAGGRSGITPERVAINLDDCSLPDNAGDVRIDRPDFCRRRYGLLYHTPREGDGAGHAGKRNPGCAFYDGRDLCVQSCDVCVLYYANRGVSGVAGGICACALSPSQVQDKRARLLWNFPRSWQGWRLRSKPFSPTHRMCIPSAAAPIEEGITLFPETHRVRCGTSQGRGFCLRQRSGHCDRGRSVPLARRR